MFSVINDRTDSMIESFMKWTNKKVLTPEEYLLFRRQAVEEELAGTERAERSSPPIVQPDEPQPVKPPKQILSKKTKKPAEGMDKPADDSAKEAAETGNDLAVEEDEIVTADDTAKYGMSEEDFMAYMNSVAD